MCKVSIILPVYGVEKYIADCVTSIIKQTFKDFELVVVDDGSKDKSIEILQDLLNNTEVKYKIITRENGGLSAARNTGINNSIGEYLTFVDSDDVLNPRYLEVLYTDAVRENNDLAIANFKWVNDSDKFKFDERRIEGYEVDKSEFLNSVIRRKIFPYFGCFMVRKSFLIKNNLFFDENVLFNVDHAMQWYLMVLVSKYTYNPTVVYNYYVRPGSIMTGTSLSKKLTGLPSVERCVNDLKENRFINSDLILTRYKAGLLRMIAINSNLDDFVSVYSKINIQSVKCILYPDIKIKMLGFGTLLGSKFVYKALGRTKQ